MTTPSKTTGLPYTSEPGCSSIGGVAQTTLPLAWSSATTYGPWHFWPAGQPSPLAVRVTSTKSVPALRGAGAAARLRFLRLAFFFFLAAPCARFLRLAFFLAFFFLAFAFA